MKIIDSLSVENYRGFKEEQTVELAEAGHVAFLVGQNNAGKTLISKILFLVSRLTTNNSNFPEVGFNYVKFTDPEFHKLNTKQTISVKLRLNKEFVKRTLEPFKGEQYSQFIIERGETTLNLRIYKANKDFKAYCFLSAKDIDAIILDNENGFRVNQNMPRFALSQMATTTNEILGQLVGTFLIFAPVRSFHASDSVFNSGSDLLQFLEVEESQSEIMSLKNLVGYYLEKLSLEVPDHVSANFNQKTLKFTFRSNLPLSSNDIGTGYTMVYILLMEIFRNQKRIIVIDEIESHLHPGLVRELLRILRQFGSQVQFIIATHSPTVIESTNDLDSLHHFQKIHQRCVIRKFLKNNPTTNDLRIVGNDMGIIPGDALLSNCVIWVEGPSEILWLRALMRSFLPTYINRNDLFGFNGGILEGLHYSILMTGGSLIANLNFAERNVEIDDIEEDFGLMILRTNPNPFVILDSDNASIDSAKYQRCLRIANEINRQNQLASWNSCTDVEINESNVSKLQNLWVLRGKELENYCPPDMLNDFYSAKSKTPNANIKGVEQVDNWDVFSETTGAGKILEERGLSGVSKSSGTLKHKMELAKFFYRNFSEDYFRSDLHEWNGVAKANLTANLTKIFDYIFVVNNLK